MTEPATPERFQGGLQAGYASAMLKTGMENRGGIWWHEAPLPRRWHDCTPWTKGWSGLTLAERCPCGAMRLDGYGRWTGKNSRRGEVKRWWKRR